MEETYYWILSMLWYCFQELISCSFSVTNISLTFDLFIIYICVFFSYLFFSVPNSLSIYNYLRLCVKRYVFVCQQAYWHLAFILLNKKNLSSVKSCEYTIINDVSANVIITIYAIVYINKQYLFDKMNSLY